MEERDFSIREVGVRIGIGVGIGSRVRIDRGGRRERHTNRCRTFVKWGGGPFRR